MKKLAFVFGILILIIILLIVGVFSVLNTNKPLAYLYIDSTDVVVDRGDGWAPAINEMEIKSGDRIKTTQTMATIIFLEGEITRLSPNTEVSVEELIEDNIKLNQNSGETWSRVTKLTGTRNYEIETPKSVATVRGTGFYIKVGEQDVVIVSDGIVAVSSKIQESVMELKDNEKAIVPDEVQKVELTPEDKVIIVENIKLDLVVIDKIRDKEIKKHGYLADQFKEQYDVTDEEAKEYVSKVDRGEVDLKEIESNIPVKILGLEKVLTLTKEKIKLNKKLEELDNES